MNANTFDYFINDLFEYFGRKQPTKNQVGQWYDKVKHLDSGAIAYVKEDFENNLDKIPGNLPKAIKASCQHWMTDHPQEAGAVNCEFCEGSGALRGEYRIKNPVYGRLRSKGPQIQTETRKPLYGLNALVPRLKPSGAMDFTVPEFTTQVMVARCGHCGGVEQFGTRSICNPMMIDEFNALRDSLDVVVIG